MGKLPRPKFLMMLLLAGASGATSLGIGWAAWSSSNELSSITAPVVLATGVTSNMAADVSADVAPPPPPPPPPPPKQPVNPPTNPPAPPPPAATASQVGRDLFFDTNLSNPTGMACATCHAPQAGFTYPNSMVNEATGVVPGIVAGRYGNRKPPTIGYAALLPNGPPQYNIQAGGYLGGLFWDGRAPNLQSQPAFPLENPNEMNNFVHDVGDPALVVQKVRQSNYAVQFEQVYGRGSLSLTTAQSFALICQAIAAWEASPQVVQFNSKYDAWLAGKAQFTAAEMAGLQLFTGSTTGAPGGPANYKNAECAVCHTIPQNPAPRGVLFTNAVFMNDGTPRNLKSPYYRQTNAAADPGGYNPLGSRYIDYGLGDYLYPANGLPAGNVGAGSNGRGDYLGIDGTFKVPTLRNVDKRPSDVFVKAYMHNGVFKSLKQVVHFYNTRNLTTFRGEVINFTQARPFADLKGQPLWPAPEYIGSTLINPTGAPASAGSSIGNLGLTNQEENDIVAFLQTLSDGYFTPGQ